MKRPAALDGPPGGGERWQEVIDDLIGEASAAPDIGTRVRYLREVARIYEQHIGDKPRALIAWQATFAQAPDNEEIALALERMAESQDAWDVVLPECENLRKEITDPGQRAALLMWLARWQERFAHNEAAADQHLAEAFPLSPVPAPIAGAIAALYRDRGEWALAAEVLERAADATRDVDESVTLLLESARLIHTRVGDGERAARMYRRVLAHRPHNPVAAEALAEIAGEAVDPAVLCERYRQGLDFDPDSLTIVRQWADLAFAHGRWDDVRYLFDHLYAKAGGGAPATRFDNRNRLNEALERFLAASRWPEAIDVLRTLAREAAGSARAKYYASAGKIAGKEMGDDAAAVELFKLALEAQPDDLPTFDRFYETLARNQSWTQAEVELRRMIERRLAAGKADDRAVMVPLWRRLGEVYRMGLRNLTAAAEAYRQCARLAPDDRYVKLVADLIDRNAAPAPPAVRSSRRDAG